MEPQMDMQQLFAAATQRRSVADAYAYGFNHPDQYWRITSDARRTELLLQLLNREAPVPLQDAIRACVEQAEPT